MDGMLRGLGSKDGTASSLLTQIFGDPATFKADARMLFDFGKGFGEGIKAVATAVKTALSIFTGGNTDPQAIGRWTAEFLAMSAALVAASPAIIAMTGITTAVGGFATALTGAWALLRTAGIVGGATTAGTAAGTAAGATAGPAAAAGGGIVARILGMFGGAVGFNATAGLSKGDQNAMVGRLGAYAQRLEGKPGADGHWVDPPARVKTPTDRLTDAIKDNTEAQKKATESAKADAVKRETEKAKELADAEKRKLDSMFAGVRNPLMSGSVGNGGSPAVAELQRRGFNVMTPGTTPNGANGNMPQAQGGDNASPDQKSGGSRSWRNNNPGNLEYGPFAKSMGAIGSDGRFARFPTYEAGRKAQEKLLFESKGYKDLTLSQAIRRWAPASENNVPAYIAAMGGDPGKRMGEYTPDQRAKLLDAMQAHEGWKVGTVTGGGNGNGGPLTTDGPVRANLMNGQYGRPGENLGTLRAGNGKTAQVNNAALPAFQGFIRELEGQGYKIKSLGGFNNRMIRGGNRLSQHAYGNAIDLNPGNNPLGTSVTDMPDNVRALAKKYGLIWGMDWKGRKDPMHFEWNGTQPWLEAQKSAQRTKDIAAGINQPPASLGKPTTEMGSSAESKPIVDQFGNQLGQTAPTRPAGDGLGSATPMREGGRGRGGNDAGGGGNVHVGSVAIHVNGSGDPKATAAEVNKEFRSAMMGRMHDIDATAV